MRRRVDLSAMPEPLRSPDATDADGRVWRSREVYEHALTLWEAGESWWDYGFTVPDAPFDPEVDL